MQAFAAKTKTKGGQGTAKKTLSRQSKAVRSILAAGVQPKLKIGAVNDPAELEADRVADQIMRMPAPAAMGMPFAPPSGTGNNAGTNTGANTVPSILRRKCTDCEDDETVRRKEVSPEPITPVHRPPEIRMKGNTGSSGGGTASPETSRAINSLGSGVPMAKSERAFFEPRFGQDLSGIRIHTGSTADTASRAINARAFSLGNNIAFASSEYRPGSHAGRTLMAHEITHSLQEGNRIRRDVTGEPILKEGGGGWVYLQHSSGTITIVDAPKKSAIGVNLPIGNKFNEAITGEIGDYPGTYFYSQSTEFGKQWIKLNSIENLNQAEVNEVKTFFGIQKSDNVLEISEETKNTLTSNSINNEVPNLTLMNCIPGTQNCHESSPTLPFEDFFSLQNYENMWEKERKSVLDLLEDGDWDTDSEAAKLNLNTMSYFSLKERLNLISFIAGGYLVGDGDEETIIKLVQSTPKTDAKIFLVEMKETGLLKTLESVMHGAEYYNYHLQLRRVWLAGLTEEELNGLLEKQIDYKMFNRKIDKARADPLWRNHSNEWKGRMKMAIGYPWTYTWTDDPPLIDIFAAGLNTRYNFKTYVNKKTIEIQVYERGDTHLPAPISSSPPLSHYDPIFLDVQTTQGSELGASLSQNLLMPAISMNAVSNLQSSKTNSFMFDLATMALPGPSWFAVGSKAARYLLLLNRVAKGVQALNLVINHTGVRQRLMQSEQGAAFCDQLDKISLIISIIDIADFGVSSLKSLKSFKKSYDTFKDSPTFSKLDPEIKSGIESVGEEFSISQIKLIEDGLSLKTIGSATRQADGTYLGRDGGKYMLSHLKYRGEPVLRNINSGQLSIGSLNGRFIKVTQKEIKAANTSYWHKRQMRKSKNTDEAWVDAYGNISYYDPKTNKLVTRLSSFGLELDHLLPEEYIKSAKNWDSLPDAWRKEILDDGRNLMPMESSLNQSKGKTVQIDNNWRSWSHYNKRKNNVHPDFLDFLKTHQQEYKNYLENEYGLKW